MLAHNDVWNAIDELAAKHGMSPSGLARRSGLDPTTFNKSKRFASDGRPRWPSTESIAKILKATNTSVSDLFGFVENIRNAPQVSIPLIGEAHAGFESASPVGTDTIAVPSPPRIISFPDRRHEPLYALSVVGDSMQPLYRDGDVLFISPNAEANAGDRVVVKRTNNEVAVKVLKEIGSDGYKFHAVNPDHDDVSLGKSEIEWIARIVYATQ
ncbi:helix-turn-helix transcriptional regulator [Acuticoccus sp. I52.16.1]|uniref:S24 family peptidase n=1 Tax=Acuticoccus sp. I52.16.1 TaxID=2928472 RepID=UPI001FD40115|nr:helix-turn-helix transcriptional regulator [Acuticoccus sp. I52.16.1]UOM36501.1 helix-turn-helix transcriptional regulator [Acuticoccus sp. I52.16.1]